MELRLLVVWGLLWLDGWLVQAQTFSSSKSESSSFSWSGLNIPHNFLNLTGPKSNPISFSNPKNLYLMFDRPTEPLFVPKGKDSKIVFKLPTDYLPSRFQSAVSELINRWSGVKNAQELEVKPIKPPDISFPQSLGRQESFSPFIPHHRRMATYLTETLVGMRSFEDFFSMSVYCHDRINPYMYAYALSIAMINRKDTQNLPLPPLSEVFPDRFMDSAVYARCRREANVVGEGSRRPIVIPRDYTASDLEIEHRIAYFREDMGVNLMHWQWHLVYPNTGSIDLVNKNRRGELFFYFHHQILARYNFERLSNKLGRVKRLLNWREPVEEGYFPKLDNVVSSRVWPQRHSGAILRDVNRVLQRLKVDIQDMERWRDRLYEAIHSGAIINSRNEIVQLTEFEGIDILGNLLEASALSLNPNYYGDLHNFGHVLMGYCHDPDGRHLESFGVVADFATAMRDPIFYRWHAFVNGIFLEHKNLLPRYTVQQLGFDKVRVTGVEVIAKESERNTLFTFWQCSDVDTSRGIDFAPRGSVFVRFTHLQHLPFVTRILIENNGAPRLGTVRIFMAPKFDERGLSMLFEDQKDLFVEIDKFAVQLNSGRNIIRRSSAESSVTIPYQRSFRNLTGVGDKPEEASYTFCGCGWPQHMLIPKGQADGLPAEYFVMVSDGAQDKVDQPPSDNTCRPAHSYCGIQNRNYPDSRNMGYPFDRMPRADASTLREFLTPNMGLIDVRIVHHEITLDHKGQPMDCT
ncbi:phenoloxidase 2-like [Schistocerca cancellata]|uniref:phenoloxidase 2-like n=1 Tax=Schistocerca cancellata TaxID=274614 RepID=UPI002118324D|nr:phenoloxidase 2-like [Schistocerca cancellata]